MLTIKYQNSFKKDFKTIKKRGYDINKLETIVDLLANREPLPAANKDHNLLAIMQVVENVTSHQIGYWSTK